MSTIPSIKTWVNMRNVLSKQQQELYIAAATNLNLRYRELLCNDFGSTLVKNCAKDFAGEIVRRYFDTTDYYITADQMLDRIVCFSYDGVPTVIELDTQVRKLVYQAHEDPRFSKSLQQITRETQSAQKRLFLKSEHTSVSGTTSRKYDDEKLMKSGKTSYRDVSYM